MVIRLGALSSVQVTLTADRPSPAQATLTSAGIGSDWHAVRAVVPHSTASATANMRRTPTTSSQLPHNRPGEPYP
jgi:hypothetical protein